MGGSICNFEDIMSEDEAPPTPLPPAAQPPYPAHPAPAAHNDEPVDKADEGVLAAGAGLGPLGFTLIGGAVAAVGLAIAMPFLRRRMKKEAPKPKRAPRKRTKAPKSEG
jgi:predicted lipid-binding transport protein (Tim44 family)